MSIAPGSRIGPYEVTGRLGSGGMGEVYRARDARLDRDVALKVLPDQWTTDPERLARFDREARVLASVNHPNIAAIYGREGADGIEALVLELVEGPTLADRIAAGPIPPEEALSIARQVALALEAAHQNDIVHRDLKPGNIKVRPDGAVKVLDFGLARVVDSAASGSSDTATITSPMTQLGIVLGTPAYMAPEQAKGKRVDERVDIWAFGCVLFEMLTGVRAFEGDDVTETLAAIVRAEPAWDRLPTDVPPAIHRLLRRCLQKDWNQRLRHVGDAILEIDDANEVGSTIGAAPADRKRTRWRLVAAWGTALAAASTAVALWMLDGPGAPTTPISFQLSELEGGTLFDTPTNLALSPDGSHLAFVATDVASGTRFVWVRPLSSPTPRRIDGTDDAAQPFWSPDSRTIAFSASGQLKKIGLDGGVAQTIASAAPRAGGSWGRDDVIVFAGSTHLYRVPATGGEPEPITSDAEVAETGPHRWPSFLPDGRRFLTVTVGAEAAYLSSLDSTDRMRLFESSSKVVASPPDHLLFVRQGVLLAQPFDFSRGVMSGEAVAVADGLRTTSFTGNFTGGAADLTASANGTLIYRTSSQQDRSTTLTWFDRRGTRLSTVAALADYQGLALSPDGTQVAYHVHTPEGGDILLMDLARRAESRITSNPAEHNTGPFWIDPSRVGYATLIGLERKLFFTRVPPRAAEPVLIITTTGSSDATSDGQVVLFRDNRALWTVPVAGGQAPARVAAGSYGEFSPDGRWIAYQSPVSGQDEVYVQPYPAADAAPVRVSTDGGLKPRWSRDGREVFFLKDDTTLLSAAVRANGQEIEVGPPEPLFRTGMDCVTCTYFPYAVAQDGRFLLTMPAEQIAGRTPAMVVINWPATVAQRRQP